jgi:hypothetical protein
LKTDFSLEKVNVVDLTGKQQQDFKKSTASARILLQSIITKHVDSNELARMGRLDLCKAFDMVYINF